jgi:DNA-binding NarL/FixJ family response regulator
MEPIKLLIVDDQQMVREGFQMLLESVPQVAVVALAADGLEALSLVRAQLPDVVLMDVRMPRLNGVETLRILRQEFPQLKVLMLTTFDDEEYIYAALKLGAGGYLLKDTPLTELVSAIQTVYRGHTQLGPTIADKVLAGLPVRTHEPGAESTLTPRELEVLKLIAQGASNKEIGQQLYITEGTVKTHVTNILNRLNLRDRTQAALYARERNLV